MHCESCGGPCPVYLGTLGHAAWYRCQHCGMQFVEEDAESSFDPESEEDES